MKNSFCSSPWFHLKKDYNGTYDTCRWASRTLGARNIAGDSIMQFYNSDEMKNLRTTLLKGESPDACGECYYQDQHHKLSGRVCQLLKSGIQPTDFEFSMLASPHYKHFEYSFHNDGNADYCPTDLQINLGSVCNSACIMCGPEASSKLALDYSKLTNINPELFPYTQLPADWTRDQDRVNRFTDEISKIPGIKYIHFLGGETLYNQSFYQICDAIIQSGASHDMIVGTTTNCTVYDERLESLITNFKEFHLGISIDAVSNLNDYIRWPSQIDQVKHHINKFVELRSRFPGLVLSARITPNIFTMYELDTLIEYLFDKEIIAESCNILTEPECLRIELLPDDIRGEIIEKLQRVVDQRKLVRSEIYNVRHQDLINAAISNTVIEYLDFMKNYKTPGDADKHRYDLVNFLKAFETLRKNSIIDYAPRYTELLRSYGY